MAAAEFEWDDAVGLAIAALAGIMFWVALRAHRRTPTTRVLLFASAFGVWFAKGLLKVAEVLWLGESAAVDALEVVMEATTLGLFFLGMVKA